MCSLSLQMYIGRIDLIWAKCHRAKRPDTLSCYFVPSKRKLLANSHESNRKIEAMEWPLLSFKKILGDALCFQINFSRRYGLEIMAISC